METCAPQIKSTEPELDIELTQVLQDNINDLSNAPSRSRSRFSPTMQARWPNSVRASATPSARFPAWWTWRTASKTPSAVRPPISRSIPRSRRGWASRPLKWRKMPPRSWTASRSTDPLISNGRPYTIRVRLGDETRTSLDAIENTVFNSSFRPHRHPGLAGHSAAVAAAERNHPREPAAHGRGDRPAWKDRTSAPPSPRSSRPCTACTCRHPSASTTEAPTRSSKNLSTSCCACCMLALALVFGVLLTEFRNFPAPIAILTSSVLSISGVIAGAADHRTRRSTWRRSWASSWSSASSPKTASCCSMPTRSFRAEGASRRDAMLHAAQRRLRPIVMTALAAVCGMLPLAFALGAGSQMLQPLAIAVIGGLTISMVLSLVVTPAGLLPPHPQSARSGCRYQLEAHHHARLVCPVFVGEKGQL